MQTGAGSSDIARKQMEAERVQPAGTPPGGGGETAPPGSGKVSSGKPKLPLVAPQPKRYHGTVTLDSTRVGRDAGKIAEEVIAHLVGLQGSTVKVTLEIEAEILGGVPENVVRTVTENSRTLKFTSQGFEKE